MSFDFFESLRAELAPHQRQVCVGGRVVVPFKVGMGVGVKRQTPEMAPHTVHFLCFDRVFPLHENNNVLMAWPLGIEIWRFVRFRE